MPGDLLLSRFDPSPGEDMELAEVGAHCRRAIEELDDPALPDRERLCRVWFLLARVAPAIDARLPALTARFDELWSAFGPARTAEPFRSPIQVIWNELSAQDLARCERLMREFARELDLALAAHEPS
jgi:hypothetical protein